jgi:hypothetical protein
MAVNVPLLRKVLEYVSEHPEEWDQRAWMQWRPRCGTTGCVAYHTLALLGYTAVFKGPEVTGWAKSPDGRSVSIPIAAADALGLDPIRRSMLFDGANTLADLWMFAAEFTDGEITVPEEFQGADVSAKVRSGQ